jgi:hypothetical protein
MSLISGGFNIRPATVDTLIERKYLICYINEYPFADGAQDVTDPTWAILGTNTEEASIDYDYDSDKIKSVTGVVSEKLKKITRSISWDPFPVYTGTSAVPNYLQQGLMKVYAQQKFSSLLNTVDCLVVATYAGTSVTVDQVTTEEYPAIRWKGSSVTFDDFSAGTGDDALSLSITTTLGGETQSAMVTIAADGKVTITGDTPGHKSTGDLLRAMSPEEREQVLKQGYVDTVRLQNNKG